MSETVRVLVSGATGRMGGTLARLIAADPRFALVGGIDRDEGGAAPGYPEVRSTGGAGELIEAADVLIDFSAPVFLRTLLDAHGDLLRGRALVVGTTGLEPGDERRLAEVSAASAVLTAANFSVGVNVLLALVEQATRALEGYDVEIVETHHRRKEDAPSGTALALGEAVAAARGEPLDALRRDGRSGRPGARPAGEVGFHAVRGGGVVGEHEVRFLSDLDQLALVHRAADRSLFAEGALRAALWLAHRPAGRYQMRDVLGLP